MDRPNTLTLANAEQRSFWEALCPAMTIAADVGAAADTCTSAASHLPLVPAKDVVGRGLSQLRSDGYMQLPPLLPSAEAAAMAEAVVAVHEACGTPVFALVYDAFWALPGRLQETLTTILGGDIQLLPDAWVWHLEPSADDAGWTPHRDRDHGTIDPDGTPQIVSVWVPLTDATPDNGCIYALPAAWDPNYHKTNPEGRTTIQQLQYVRALPAAAGSVLCWTHQLLHWGGRSSDFAKGPRISVAYEVQRAAVPALSKPLLAIDALPTFAARLGLIGRMLLQYQQMHPLPKPLVKLARQLRKHMPGRRSFASILAGVRGK